MMNKFNNIAALILTLMLIGQPFSGFAQEEEKDENNLGSQVNISEGKRVINYDPHKFGFMPEPIDTNVVIETTDYPLLNKTVPVEVKPEQIRPARLKVVEPISKLYNGYVKAGFGMFSSPLFDFHYMDKRNRTGSYGIKLHHFSSRDGLKNYAYSGFSENNIGLYGKKLMENHILEGAVNFDYNTLHFYGIPSPEDSAISTPDIRQRFTNFGLNGSYSSYFEDTAKMNYKIFANYNHFRDFNDLVDTVKFDRAKEHAFTVGTNLSKYMRKELYQLDAAFDFNHYDADYRRPCTVCDTFPNAKINNNAIFRLKPSVSIGDENWKLKVGLGVFMDLPNQMRDVATFHFYPDARFHYSFFDNILIPYMGITGNLKRNSFRSLAAQNPFVLSHLELRNTSQQFKFYGGIKGAISSTTSFNIFGSHEKVNNLPLFVTDTTYSYNNRFDVVYDSLRITKLGAQLSFQKDEQLELMLKGEYFIYSPIRQLEAWNMPDLRITFSGSYDLEDKLIVKLDAFVESGRTALAFEPGEDREAKNDVYLADLGTFVDLNLGAEYRYTRRLSVFLNFNNLLSKRYQYWLDYPVQGINILGGLTYSF